MEPHGIPWDPWDPNTKSLGSPNTIVCLLVCLFVCSFVRSFVRSCVCLFVCLSVCLFVCSFDRVCLFVCLLVCLFISGSVLASNAFSTFGRIGSCQSSPTPNGKGRQTLLFLEATVGIALFPKLRANWCVFLKLRCKLSCFPKLRHKLDHVCHFSGNCGANCSFS